MTTFQEIMASIDRLSSEELDSLSEVIRHRRRKEQEMDILASRQELKQAIADGTAKRGDVRELIAELLGDDDANCLE
jgi:predicted CopG family antitoxin